MISYDFLVIGLGVKTSYFGNDEWANFAPGLKTLDGATGMRRNILQAFEDAEAKDDRSQVEKLLTIVVIGGGPTGVELAGSFAELAKRVVADDFRRIDTAKTKVILIEGGERLLPMYPEGLSDYTKRRLEKMGVTVKLGKNVSEIGEDFVILGEDRIEAANVIWAAGVQAPKLTETLGVELDRAGRIKVEPSLRLPEYPNVFAIGDIASVMDQDGKPVPGLCPAAIQMGKHVARGIMSESAEPFRYFDKGSMATIGRKAAVAQFGGGQFTGFLAWLMWLFVHLMFLIGFRNKVAVFWQWFYSYFTYKRGARIITGVKTDGKT